MSDAAAHIAREAKGLQQGLKELLKTRDITDREIDIQRKNLRRQYLRLLFLHPYVRESKDAETHLWMQTSYSIISIYKQRIAALDRAIHNPPRQGGQQQSSHSSRTVEYRKLLQRFRQFLAEEEKFWMQLVLRLRRYFLLEDAQPALTTLGIIPEDDQTPAADTATYPRRNQHQFPPESDGSANGALVPTSSSQRESRMAILSKALVCLGDIARYKEQYNEAGGRPRAGHEDGPPAAMSGRGGRGRRGGAAGGNHVPLPRLRNYDRAQSCYEQARLLLPHDGNPSHQLAILSSYQKDTLSCIVHYYRALCVRSPYETASENLGTVLHKALEQYKAKGLLREAEAQEELASTGAVTPRLRVESFKEKVVVLHAQWCMNVDDAKTMGEKVIDEFRGLVSDRILPIEMISKIIILVQGALWKHRMVRRPSNADRRSPRPSTTESNIITHLLATHRVLLENGSIELAESPPEDSVEGDLAQRITATFRRTLPALRMSGKWLRSNTRYLSQGLKQGTNNEVDVSTTRDSGNRKDRRNGGTPIHIGGIHDFWREYVRFCEALVDAFPVDKLPELRTQLEEDIDTAGFLPLRKYMTGTDGKPLGGSKQAPPETDHTNSADGDLATSHERAPSRDQVHPNEEQLMRIADILTDAKAVAEDEYTPITLESGHFSLNASLSSTAVRAPDSVSTATREAPDTNDVPEAPIPNNTSKASIDAFSLPHPRAMQEADADEDAVSATTDDPIREAFDMALDHSDDDNDDDEEQIVWQPGGPLSPHKDPVVTTLPTTPPRLDPIGTTSFGTPRRPDPVSPPFKHRDLQRSPTSYNTPRTTAGDLLQNVLGLRSPPALHQRTSSTPAVNPIPGASTIWSSHESFHYANGNRGLGNGSQYVPQSELNQLGTGLPLPASQNPRSSSYPWQSSIPLQPSQNVQPEYTNGSSRSLLPQHPSIANSGHQRLPSETLMTSRPQTLPPPVLPPAHRYDPLNSSAPFAAAPLNATYGMPTRGVVDQLASGGYSDVFSVPSGSAYYHSPQPDLFHHAGVNHVHADHPFIPQYDGAQSASRIWGNPG